MELPNDLKNFHDERGVRRREYLFAVIALILWAATWFLPSEPIVKAAPVAKSEVQRELRCDCPKMNAKREWLRVHVAHQADRFPCTVTCEYGRTYFVAEDL